MRTTALITLVLILLLTGTVAAAGVTVSVSSGVTIEGSSVSVPVVVSGASNLGAMDLIIAYDPAVLSFSSAELGALSTNGIVEANEASPGTVKISFADTNGITGDGEILKLNFRIATTSKSSTELALSGQAYGLDLKDIPTTGQGAVVMVPAPKSDPGGMVLLLALIAGCLLGVRRYS